MEELLRQAIKALKDIWHRRWVGLGVAWLVAIIGTVIVLRLPDRYEATARVFVDTESVLKPLMSGMTVQPNINQRVAILSRTLISRPNLEKLIRMTDLDHSIKGEKEKERVIEDLSKNLKLQSVQGANNLYTITFRDPIPARAQKTVQSLLSIFVESGLGEKREDTATARDFIDRQIKDYEQKLMEAENRMKEFRLKHMTLLAGGSDHFSKMDTIGAQVQRARLELREAEEAREAVRRQVNSEDSGTEAILVEDREAETTQQRPMEIDGRIQTLQKDLDALLRRYTDRHPDVVATQRLIGQLEEQRKAEIEALRNVVRPATRARQMNPLKQQLQISLVEADSNVAALRARVREYELQYGQLQAMSKNVPEIEAESAQLNRDYAIIKKQYSDLVERRETVTLTNELEAAGSIASFRTIDPPRVAMKPSDPNRLLLLTGVLIISLGAGVAASFLASQIFATFHDARHLREITKRPVLGTVSMLESDGIRRLQRKGNLLFLSAVGGLASSFGMVIAFLVITRP